MKKSESPVQNISVDEFNRIRSDFANRLGDNRVQMFRTLADSLASGWFEYHQWTLKIIEAACKYRWIALSGCSNSAKTRNVAGFSAVWWLADPANSSVTFCSTTMKMLRKRGWSEIQSFYNAIGADFGNMVDSRTMWQYDQGDDKHAIFGKAVAEGDVHKSAADLQGLHTKRQMIVIDEAEAVPPSIWRVCSNAYGYCVDVGGEFILIAIANARSRLSQFGRFMEPEDGWASVSVDSDDWFSKPQMDGKKAIVLRFDFRKSPNLVEGRVVSRHLPTRQRVENRLAALKARGGENDPDHWCYDLGFPAPEGLTKTVFTESLFEKFGAYDRHRFTGTNFMIIGAVDPAYGGGDRPALRFAALGDIEGDKMGIEWMEPILLYTDATVTEPASYQLLAQIRKHAQNVQYRGQTYVCPPENIGIDTTGNTSLADAAQREWSPRVIRINFSESPSDEPCSHEDIRPGSEVYLNKRSEMYYQTRNALIAGQLRNVDKDTAAELCTIEELIEKTDGTIRTKLTLMSKREYKKKFAKSPDLADCGVEITEVARLKGFHIAAIGLTIDRESALAEVAKDAMSLYDPDTFYQSANDNFVEEEEFT